jgi:hypothetical protein
MASIISADNGSISGSAGLKSSADGSGILQLQTGANVNAFQIDVNQYPSATVNGLGKGAVPAEQLYRLNSALAGANATGAQSILGAGVTLVGSTVYQFEALYALSKSAGVTSHTISLLFGGTATINNIAYSVYSQTDTSAWIGIPPSGVLTYGLIQVATATAITGAQTAAAQFRTTFIKGIVSINAGGTFIPQYSLSAAPGGAYTTAANSYFKISPLGASGSNTSIGSWA